MPETTVAAPAQQADALDPAQTPYATELLNRAEMERQQVLDIRDATRDMVNVEVPRQPAGTGISGTTGREGNTGFEIRGLGGNRVQMLVDGIPQPEADSFMNSHSFGRDYVDPLTLSYIEVHKGVSPVSMPAGGIAGAVNLRTLSPSDLLLDGKTLAGRALLGWRSESQGLTAGAVLAGKASDQLQWLFALNGDWSDETETMGRVGAQASSAPGPIPRTSAATRCWPSWSTSPMPTRAICSRSSAAARARMSTTCMILPTARPRATPTTTSTRNRVSLKSDFRLNAAAADLLTGYLAWQDSSSTRSWMWIPPPRPARARPQL
jgi:hemoglobin/transferrin/lactoferrin receptor protein